MIISTYTNHLYKKALDSFTESKPFLEKNALFLSAIMLATILLSVASTLFSADYLNGQLSKIFGFDATIPAYAVLVVIEMLIIGSIGSAFGDLLAGRPTIVIAKLAICAAASYTSFHFCINGVQVVREKAHTEVVDYDDAALVKYSQDTAAINALYNPLIAAEQAGVVKLAKQYENTNTPNKLNNQKHHANKRLKDNIDKKTTALAAALEEYNNTKASEDRNTLLVESKELAEDYKMYGYCIEGGKIVLALLYQLFLLQGIGDLRKNKVTANAVAELEKKARNKEVEMMLPEVVEEEAPKTVVIQNEPAKIEPAKTLQTAGFKFVNKDEIPEETINKLEALKTCGIEYHSKFGRNIQGWIDEKSRLTHKQISSINNRYNELNK